MKTKYNKPVLKKIDTCICGGKLVEPTKTYIEVGPSLKNVVICEDCETMYGEKE